MQRVAALPEDKQPAEYVLVRFGDPTVGAPIIVGEPNALLAEVQKLNPNLGGDCPELAMSGLRRILPALGEGSSVYLYTDADAKDSGLATSVASQARAKGVRITSFLSGRCASSTTFDPAYFNVGRVVQLAPGSTSQVTDLLVQGLEGTQQTVLSQQGTLGSSSSPASYADRIVSPIVATEDVDFVVDPTISDLAITVSVEDLTDIKIFDPNGMEVTDSDPDVTIADNGNGVIGTIEGPDDGDWRVEGDRLGHLFGDRERLVPGRFRALRLRRDARSQRPRGLLSATGAPGFWAALARPGAHGRPGRQRRLRACATWAEI